MPDFFGIIILVEPGRQFPAVVFDESLRGVPVAQTARIASSSPDPVGTAALGLLAKYHRVSGELAVRLPGIQAKPLVSGVAHPVPGVLQPVGTVLPALVGEPGDFIIAPNPVKFALCVRLSRMRLAP